MPSDDYSYAGGGALKLKGAKVKKNKNKKKRDKPRDLERALSTSDERSVTPDNHALTRRNGEDDQPVRPIRPSKETTSPEPPEDDSAPVLSRKTEAERRFDEAKRKKVGESSISPPARQATLSGRLVLTGPPPPTRSC